MQPGNQGNRCNGILSNFPEVASPFAAVFAATASTVPKPRLGNLCTKLVHN